MLINPRKCCLVLTVLTAVTLPAAGGANAQDCLHWPSFRGPHARGFADCSTAPVEWDVAASKNIVFNTPIPGLAHSSPVIWGDRLFVTTAVSDDPDPYLRVGLYGESPDHPEEIEHRFKVYCLDKNTGDILWEKTAHAGIPKVKRHIKATHANSSPATDGKHVVALFGSEGLYCYDVNGKLLWEKDLGLLDSGPFGENWRKIQWGYASSPVIHDGRVIIQADTRAAKFLAAFDIETGKEIWRTARDDYPTFSTPTVHEDAQRTQVIVNGYRHIAGYDFKTGEQLWNLHGGGDVPTPTPVVAGDLIFITNAHGGLAPIYAIRTDATGDITPESDSTTSKYIPWSYERRGAYMQTPLVYRGLLYNCKGSGILTVYDAKTGKRHYSKRLGGGQTGFTASPVAADGKVYFSSEEGDIYVVKAGKEFEGLAENEMGEVCMATPAISEGILYFRTQHHVVAVGDQEAN
jgi:outer membrane protein assembly factor BamB